MDEKNNAVSDKTQLSQSTHSDSDTLTIRKEKILSLAKKSNLIVFILLVLALLLGVYLRSLPMMDHSAGIPTFSQFLFGFGNVYEGKLGLWDITTNTWTLGPDLDPWLFLRNAKTIVQTGVLPERDMMRNVPLGFDNSIESKLLPYMIAWTYYVFQWLGINSNVEFAGVIFPVIMFFFTIIAFFLFVREAFLDTEKKEKAKANAIAIIATFFMITIPVFISRTIAGIPEKESVAFFFLFLSLYFFLKAWRSKILVYAGLFGLGAGIATGLMGLVWGGVLYSFITIGLATLIGFVLHKIDTQKMTAYSIWIISSFGILFIFSKKYSIEEMFTSLSSGIAAFTAGVLIIHLLLFHTAFKKRIIDNATIKRWQLPTPLLSIGITILILLIVSIVVMGPSFVIEKIKAVHQTIFKPVFGRWNITVAENRQPDFLEWSQSFGPFFKNIPIFFWLFFIGSVVMFKKTIGELKKKDVRILTVFFILFLTGVIFSRYSSGSIFNGENFVSKAFYYLSALVFIGAVILCYIRYYRHEEKSFENISFGYILSLCLFILALFTARGAVRLIMVLGPIAPIFVAFLIVELVYGFLKTNERAAKMMLGVALIVIIWSSSYSFWTFYQSSQGQGYSYIPSAYNLQWQKAMEWVRNNTPQEAVFSHWWDYGYWVQSIGNRATIVDGGNAITYWNYLVGRHVLTGDNEPDALEFLYNHNVTHLLIDSSDIGKYTAFSSIGSDEKYDRYSWIQPFLLDDRQTQETKNKTNYVYSGGLPLDEDILIQENGNQILLPAQKAAVGAIILPLATNDSKIEQPQVILVYQSKQYQVKFRYVFINGQLLDFQSGSEGAIYIFPQLNVVDQRVSENPRGAAMVITPRLFRGMFSQLYLMNDPLKKFPHISLVHTEESLLVDDLKGQGMNLPSFVYYNGVHGPIKIWEVHYTGKEQIKQEYLDTDASKYLSWRL